MPCGQSPPGRASLRGQDRPGSRAASRRRRARATPGARRAERPRRVMPRWRSVALRVREGQGEGRAPPRSGRGTSARAPAPSSRDAGDAGREGQPHEAARRQAHALAQADDRDRARRRSCRRAAGRRGAWGSSGRGRGRGSARGRSPIPPDPAARPSGSARGRPRPRPRRRRAGAGEQSRAALSGRYSVSTKSLPNAGWARSSAARAEDDLGVARDLDLARAVAVVRDRQAPHLDVVLGRDRDVEQRRDVVVAAAERRLLGEERHQVVLGLARPSGGRPPTRPRRCARRAGR